MRSIQKLWACTAGFQKHILKADSQINIDTLQIFCNNDKYHEQLVMLKIWGTSKNCVYSPNPMLLCFGCFFSLLCLALCVCAKIHVHVLVFCPSLCMCVCGVCMGVCVCAHATGFNCSRIFHTHTHNMLHHNFSSALRTELNPKP